MRWRQRRICKHGLFARPLRPDAILHHLPLRVRIFLRHAVDGDGFDALDQPFLETGIQVCSLIDEQPRPFGQHQIQLL